MGLSTISMGTRSHKIKAFDQVGFVKRRRQYDEIAD